MRLLPLAALLAALAAPALATDPPPMAAAGLLERDGRTDCSGVLIEPDLVATAGHCVAGKKLVAEGGENRISFRTGSYPGHPGTEHEAVKIMQHPLYLTTRAVSSKILTADIALIALGEPVPPEAARPIPWGEPVGPDESLLIASYPGGKGARARERTCPVLIADGSLARLSCHVVPGESGAPVVRLTGDGPELAAVLVAASKERRQPYALTVQARTRLLQLYAVWNLETP